MSFLRVLVIFVPPQPPIPMSQPTQILSVFYTFVTLEWGVAGDGKKILKPIELVSFLFMKFGVPLRRKNGQTTKVSVIFVHLSQKPS